jgi:hypothetical protein
VTVNLSIKGVPQELAERLRRRAKRNRRSLQGELMAIIEAAAGEPVEAPTRSDTLFVAGPDPQRPGQLRHTGSLAGRKVGTKTIDEIMAELRKKYPNGMPDAFLGVDIIRKARDSR